MALRLHTSPFSRGLLGRSGSVQRNREGDKDRNLEHMFICLLIYLETIFLETYCVPVTVVGAGVTPVYMKHGHLHVKGWKGWNYKAEEPIHS